MLNRRHLRIKVMQALYAYFQSHNHEVAIGEKELLKSINKLYDLYIYILLLVMEVFEFAEHRMEENKLKRLPTQEDLNPNTRFVDNTVAKMLMDSPYLKREIEARKLSWADEKELIRKIFRDIREDEHYEDYMNAPSTDFEKDKQMVIRVFKHHIAGHEHLHFLYEEHSIFWASDLDVVNTAVLKTLQGLKEGDDLNWLLPLYKDVEDDRKFVIDLYRKTIVHSEEYSQLIETKTKNWEMDRIAVLDILLMKMAVSELLNFSSIPTKVTLNEYIEISKDFSTPKSKIFINGILDQLLADFKRENKLDKAGRGLMEG